MSCSICGCTHQPTIKFSKSHSGIDCIYWENENKLLHRDGDLPSVVYYYPNGKVYVVKYYKHGKLHREGGKAAYIYYYKNGKVCFEENWEHGNIIGSKEGKECKSSAKDYLAIFYRPHGAEVPNAT